ncbi:DUF3810 domain-containing protein [Bacteroides sp. 51]|uniref:DUF3810 domain-containing protein n=1 Tax=Bacteroides sp. 51 TaxID=2302938 RepID=UPI00194038FF|nr:DUF3810 domain-containing protein [Bacteroides sp. 51]NDV82380.1 DUF3810 domain-containing protein [Bacteroides sp. 51]
MQRLNLKRSTIIHYSLLGLALLTIWLTQAIPAWGEAYARTLYPVISCILMPLSGWIPFSLGDLFITLSIAWVILYPIYGTIKKIGWKKTLKRIITYLAWVYVWFYLAWGLNYSQRNFYQRTKTPYVAYTPENFKGFLDDYIEKLNAAYVPVSELEELDKTLVHTEVINQYKQLSPSLGMHPPKGNPRVKTMMFTPLFSKMAITGYMGPFFCEFNLNGDLLPSQYADTYAHEMAHLLGITSEAEANFYAYQICIHSDDARIRYCGYFSVFHHVLNNARRLMSENKEEYKALLERIRPEIIEQATTEHEYWMAKYSPTISNIQSRIYDWYLKGNKIESGRKNYSEVVGLLISYHNK